ncbi:hypothetical protein MTYP_01018 [Methylophilaceae bacterium]|nr:hypothetical protein MTYP_01018 [Methylophilaceae bacterium]
MSAFSKIIRTEDDIDIRVIGWPADQDRRRPTVYVAFHYYPLDTNITMSAADARELASTLLKAAEAAEKSQEEEAA